MENTVSAMSILFILVALVLGIAIPIVLPVVFRKKFKCNISAFFIGGAVMILFAFVLEQTAHKIVLGSPIGGMIQNKLWLYGIYGGFMAALFEETGRYLAFRFLLRKNQNNNYNALMYGAGHGGIEMMVLMIPVMLNNLIYAIMINTGTMTQVIASLPGEQAEILNAVVEQMINISPVMFLVSPLERIAAVVLQLSFSVLVWFAAKQKKTIVLLPAAMLLHMLVDTITVVAGRAGMNMIAVEALVYIMTAAIALIAIRIWKIHKND